MGESRRDVYIPLLFLMLEGKLEIWQDEFFGEVYVGERAAGDGPEDADRA
jgi:segregation and condensation protein A